MIYGNDQSQKPWVLTINLVDIANNSTEINLKGKVVSSEVGNGKQLAPIKMTTESRPIFIPKKIPLTQTNPLR